jgi:hypothetical protein
MSPFVALRDILHTLNCPVAFGGEADINGELCWLNWL